MRFPDRIPANKRAEAQAMLFPALRPGEGREKPKSALFIWRIIDYYRDSTPS